MNSSHDIRGGSLVEYVLFTMIGLLLVGGVTYQLVPQFQDGMEQLKGRIVEAIVGEELLVAEGGGELSLESLESAPAEEESVTEEKTTAKGGTTSGGGGRGKKGTSPFGETTLDEEEGTGARERLSEAEGNVGTGGGRKGGSSFVYGGGRSGGADLETETSAPPTQSVAQETKGVRRVADTEKEAFATQKVDWLFILMILLGIIVGLMGTFEIWRRIRGRMS